ncbi:MAG: hypothetical protein JWQ68_447 [Cryobacterium sp.]|nr:hypothetical protein [Cryobacterium sp.]
MMEEAVVILRMQHPVPDYARWKRAFDLDPADRGGSGLLRYAIHRSVSDPHLVMVDMEFGSRGEAEVFLTKMRRVWSASGSAVTNDAEAWIVEKVDGADLVDRPQRDGPDLVDGS